MAFRSLVVVNALKRQELQTGQTELQREGLHQKRLMLDQTSELRLLAKLWATTAQERRQKGDSLPLTVH